MYYTLAKINVRRKRSGRAGGRGRVDQLLYILVRFNLTRLLNGGN